MASAAGDRSLTGLVVTAGAGALAAAAGMYLFKKIKKHRSKPKVKISQRDHLSLSTRCTWLISGNYRRNTLQIYSVHKKEAYKTS